jgi:peptidoglycan/LPS O-acetylase OafA/YrhL
MATPSPQTPREPGATESLPHLADPGKLDRSAHGVPVVAAYDGYRALAVLAVVLFHVLASSGLLIRAGDRLPALLVWGTLPYGISVFFIVSGFVMFLPTAAREGRFGRVSTFAIRRSARLFPALWLALTVVLLLLATIPNAPQTMPGIGEIALNYSGQAGWATLVDPGQAAGFGVDTPVYTLTIEIAFYLVLPLVAAAFFRRPLLGLAAGAALAVLWRLGFANIEQLASSFGISLSPGRELSLQFADNQFPLWAFSFAAGMASALAYVRLSRDRDREGIERLAPKVAAVSLAAAAICAYLAGRYAIGSQPAAVIWAAWQSSLLTLAYNTALAVLMLAVAFAPARIQRPFSGRRIRALADISYGVYLIHAVVLWLIVIEISPPQNGSFTTFALMLAIVLSVSVAYGYASTRFVEQPVRRWARRSGGRTKLGRRPASARAPTSG